MEQKTDRLKKAIRLSAIIGPLLLMLLLAWTPGISLTEDLGRHILLGQIISQENVVPKTNYLTYTHPDFPFVNHHWLSEVVFYQLHRLGGYNGLIFLKMIMMTGALALAMLTVRGSRRILVLWFAGILAAVMLSFRSHIRPELFTFLGVALYLFCFERIRDGARWPWLATVVYMWLWSNAQIYFIFGLFMCASFAAETYRSHSDTSAFGVRRSAFGVRPLYIWFALLLLVCILNPNGFAGLLYPFRIFSNYEVGITENASVFEYWQSVINPMMLALPFASILALWAAWKNWRTRPANSIIVIAALIASWWMARSVPLLALALLPAVAGIPNAECRMPNNTQVSGFRFQVSALLAATVLLVLNAFLICAVFSGAFHRPFPSPIGPTPFGFDDEDRFLALRRLQSDGLPGQIFTDYNSGSLAEYNLWPALRGYVDNRPEAFPGAFWRSEYTPALALGQSWNETRQLRGINTVAVSFAGVKEAYCAELMRRPEWILVHLDAFMGVWVWNSPENAGFLRKKALSDEKLQEYVDALGDRVASIPSLPPWRRQIEADRAVYECYSLICIGQTPLAWPTIWSLHQAYPDYQIVHELMRVSAPRERVNDVKRVMARHARWPLAVKQVLDWGRVLESEGRLDEAGHAYRRGSVFFPLSKSLRDAVKAVDDRRYREQLSRSPAS